MRTFGSMARVMRSLAALVITGAAASAQAQTGTVSVSVTEMGGGAIAQAQVALVGTTIGGLTGLDGKLLLRGVPAGAQTVRVLRVGFSEQKKAIEVPLGGSIGVEFQMSAVAVSLTPVVTTATGETRRVEIGNAVSSFTVSEITEKAPISSVNDVINARTPGVSVQLGTQTGTGARIRIRGANSLSLSNEPIWIIDGVRMTSDFAGPGTGGNGAARTGDINPDEIESVEIVKGPSAATLYGTDAANGVIVVTTKKGRAGTTRWNAFGEGGILADRVNQYPWNYTIAGHTAANPNTYVNCLGLVAVSQGSCIMDSVRQYSPFHDPTNTPISQGDRSQYSVQALGGNEQIRYFIGLDQEKETGVLRLPQTDRRRIDSSGVGYHPWVDRPNMLAKYSFRVNLQTQLLNNLDVQFQTNYINLYQRFTLESNATAGLGSQAFGGPGYKTNGFISGVNTPLNGYRAWTPGYTWQERNDQGLNRLLMSVNLNWRPTSWLQNRVNLGTDFSNAVNGDLLFRGEGPPLTATYRNGFSLQTRNNTRTTTADFGSTATWRLRDWAIAKTTVGIQYTNYQSDQSAANGTELPPGAQTPGGAVTQTAGQSTTFTKTLGMFVEEALAFNDRLFITGAVRSDQNSAFGTNFQNVAYPKLSASWVVSDEPWFRAFRGLNSLRLRAAYGTSGVQPGPNDALRFFQTTTVNIRGVESSGETFSAIGNAALRPEQSTEYEGGFEAKFFDNRYSLDVTYYLKRTKDALISAIVPPSYGGPNNVRQNLGATQNQGWEFLINGQLIDRPNFGMDLTINASKNANKLVSLGGTPPQIGTNTRAVQNYPLFGYWAAPITGWNDKNGDKILTPDELTVGRLCSAADVSNTQRKCSAAGAMDTSAVFVGYSSPRQFLSVTPGFDLLRKKLRLQALFDYRGGNAYYNNTERIRCVSRQNCNGFMNPKSSFEEQAMVVGTLYDPTKTLWGFYQSGDFVKLREVSASYDLPTSWAAQLRAKTARISISGRNVWKYSLYKGVDPENDFTITGGTQNTPQDFQTIGAPTYYTIRLAVTF
jgi:TonB-linked SusC/RagA family outer membrane protein